MENASKALIIAATTMIALMILAALVYLFRQGSRMSENYDRGQIQRNLELYNSRFLNFNNDRNTLSDIISVCNLAYNTNVDTDYDDAWCVQINIDIFGNTYVIPSERPSSAEYGRNMIFYGNDIISIYDLATKSLYDLECNNPDPTIIKDGELLKGIKLNEKVKYKIKNQPEGSDQEVEDFLFFFECDQSAKKEIKVNSSGRVCEMNFKANVNTEIDHIEEW